MSRQEAGSTPELELVAEMSFGLSILLESGIMLPGGRTLRGGFRSSGRVLCRGWVEAALAGPPRTASNRLFCR